MRRLVMWATVAFAAAGACASPPAEPADVVRTDSAGVRIVSSGAEDRELPWRFDSVDVLHDSVGEPWLFTSMSPGTVLIDRAGRVYAITQDPSIVRFGLDGRFDRTIGRKGSGPGEYELPVSISAHGDTLVVRDIARQVLVRFSSSLDPVPDRRLVGALTGAGAIEFRSGGLWILKQVNADTVRRVELRADTAEGAPLRQLPLTLGRPVRYGCVGFPFAPPFFEPTILWSASGARIVVNEQPSYELWLYEGARAVARVERRLRPRAPTVEDVRARMPEGLVVSFLGERPDCRIPVEEVVAKQGMAPHLPLVEEVQLFSDGTIWTRRAMRTADTVEVDVFGSDGAYVGTARDVALPLARYPNGDLLVPREHEESGGVVFVRMRVRR